MEKLGHAIKRKMNDPRQSIRFDGADLLTRKGYTLVPNMILNQESLSAIAKLTYAMLLKYAWDKNFCFPGQKRLADDMQVSERYAHAAIKELEQAKLISIKRQGQGKPNIYTLHVRVESSRNNPTFSSAHDAVQDPNSPSFSS